MLCVAFPSGVFDTVPIRQGARETWKFAQLLKDCCHYLFCMLCRKKRKKEKFLWHNTLLEGQIRCTRLLRKRPHSLLFSGYD
jgi:hypothetical protein